MYVIPLTKQVNKVHYLSGNDDWETPADVFHKYDVTYKFMLDAAANESNHKCERWFGPGGDVENALTAEWPLEHGNIWLNPPYSRGLQAKFVNKAWSEHIRCKMEDKPYGKIVCLLPARTDTKLFHDVVLPYGQIEFLRGRVTFVGAAASAPFPSMIVVF